MNLKNYERLLSTFAIGLIALISLESAQAANIAFNTTVRDFQASHPDFEDYISFLTRGLVSSTLPANKKPVFAGNSGEGSITDSTTFNQWYKNVPGVNLATTIPLVLTETSPNTGLYTYTNQNFFPIDNQLFGNEDFVHNYHFTLEAHSSYTYQPGQNLKFEGDDDIWVYLNNRLIIDLGGVHPSAAQAVNLDNLGLTPGNTYDLDFYFAERHTTASSLQITLGNFSIVPLPGAIWLFGMSLLGLFGLKHRRTP